MADKSNKSEKPKITDLSASTTLSGSIHPEAANIAIPGMGASPGKTVSLNLKNRQYWAIPGFRLTAEVPTAEIPVGLTPQALSMIQRGLDMGSLVPGNKPVPKFEKNPNELNKYLNLLKELRDVRHLHPHIEKLANTNSLLGGYSKHEVVEAMRDAEMQGLCRQPVVEYLDRALNYMPGHSRVRDSVAPRKVPPVHQQVVNQPAADPAATQEALKEI